MHIWLQRDQDQSCKIITILVIFVLVANASAWTSALYVNMGAVSLTRAGAYHEVVQQQPSLYRSAVADLQTATRLDAGNARAQRLLGQVFLSLGNFQMAIDSLSLSRAMDPANELTAFFLGRAYEAEGNLSAATRTWVAADLESVALQKADRLFQSGDLELAMVEYVSILGMKPSVAGAYLGIGRIWVQKGRWDLAQEYFQQAWSSAPDNVEVLVELGTAYYYGQGDREMSLKVMGAAIERTPSCYWCYLKMGAVLEDSGDFEQAIAVLLRAKSVASDQNAILYSLLARNYLRAGHLADALSVVQEGLGKYPKDAYLHFVSGNVYVALGRVSDALESYRQALAIAPDNREFKDALERLERSSK